MRRDGRLGLSSSPLLQVDRNLLSSQCSLERPRSLWLIAAAAWLSEISHPRRTRFLLRTRVTSNEPAHRLLLALPGISPLAVWLVFGPLLFAHRLSGYLPPTFRYPFEGDVTLNNRASARQTFYDSVVNQYLADVVQP